MEIVIQEDVVLNTVSISVLSVSGRAVPRGDRHGLHPVNECIPCLERLPVSSWE